MIAGADPDFGVRVSPVGSDPLEASKFFNRPYPGMKISVKICKDVIP